MRFSDIVLRFRDDAEFEQKHDRDENGKFSSGGSSGSTSSSEEQNSSAFDAEKFKELIGPEFSGVRRQAAVRKLIEEKRGHVKGAFHRKDIGDIDLVWGNEQIGLSHIIARRSKSGLDGEKFAESLSDVIQNGDLIYRKDRNNYEIWWQGKLAVVTKQFMGSDACFVVTAFPSRKKPARFNEQA